MDGERRQCSRRRWEDQKSLGGKMEEWCRCILVGRPVVAMEDAKLGADFWLLGRVCCGMTFMPSCFMAWDGMGWDRFGLHGIGTFGTDSVVFIDTQCICHTKVMANFVSWNLHLYCAWIGYLVRSITLQKQWNAISHAVVKSENDKLHG